MSTENATGDIVTVLTTVATTEADFNFSGLWISLGVLGGFVLGVFLYGLCTTLLGRLDLPQMTAEDKQPLAGDHEHGQDHGGSKASEKTNPTDTAADGAAARVEPAVNAMPPSYNDSQSRYDKATATDIATAGDQSRGQDKATGSSVDIGSSREDLVEGPAIDSPSDVAIEVYERDVDIDDERKK